MNTFEFESSSEVDEVIGNQESLLRFDNLVVVAEI